jgi:hypothetical protein
MLKRRRSDSWVERRPDLQLSFHPIQCRARKHPPVLIVNPQCLSPLIQQANWIDTATGRWARANL